MTTPVNTVMYVRRDTLPPVPPKCVLSEDPNRPTPSLTQVTVYDRTSDSGTYSTSACQAIVTVTASEWTNMCNLLSDPTHQVQVGITYDNSVVGTNKPLLSPVTFTLVNPLPGGLLAQVASAVHAVEERVETGVSGDIREDIHHTKAVVDDMAKTLDGIKATVDAIKSKVDRL